MIRANTLIKIFITILLAGVIGCGKIPSEAENINPEPPAAYQTKNVIIIVVDGARYSETWGDPSHKYIPKRYALLPQGVLCNRLYNDGTTSTVPGHTAIVTGYYQFIANDGTAYPEKPTIFQSWLQTYDQPSSKAWIIATKDKLEVLSDCQQPDWKGKYKPMTDCGVAGIGSGYRNDDITFKNAQSIINLYHPQLVLINFKEPDNAGHRADSAGYLKGIIDTDNYISLLWQQLQSDDFYRDKTTMIITNDHGRHTPGNLNGYISHGDACDGCRHIEMFAIGPDFKKNYTSQIIYSQVDIAATIATLLKINMPYSNGKTITDIFR